MSFLRSALTYALLALIALTTITPLVWMAAFSLHPPLAPPPTTGNLFAPESWHPENYRTVLTIPELPVWRFALNTILVTAGVVVFQLILCSLAAYGFARLQFPGRDALFFIFLITM